VAAVHGAVACRHEENAIGIAVRESGDGRSLVFGQGIVHLVPVKETLLGEGDGLSPYRIIPVFPVDERRVVGGQRDVILGDRREKGLFLFPG
jgi:hypothetical protein